MKYIKTLLILLVLCPWLNSFSRSFFVKETGIGDFSGKDWQNAIDGNNFVRSLENALPLDTFYLAQGSYTPFLATMKTDGSTLSNSTNCTFFVTGGVSIIGGYSNLSIDKSLQNRDINQYQTILTGDLCGYHSNHVITISGTAGGVLDGLVIKDGLAAGVGEDAKGGGIYVADSTFNVSVIACQITGNSALIGGGGINISGAARVIIERTTISDNTCSSTSALFGGGGMLIAGSLTAETQVQLINSTIALNKANLSLGGGICVYKPAYTKANFSAFFSTIVSNSAKKAGGIYTDSIIVLDNVILAGNTGYEIYCKSASDKDAIKSITCLNSIVCNNRYITSTNQDLTAKFPATVSEYLVYNSWKLSPTTTPTLALVASSSNPAINKGDIDHLNTTDQQTIYTKCKFAQNNLSRLIQPSIGAFQSSLLTSSQSEFENSVVCFLSNKIIHIEVPQLVLTVEIYNAMGQLLTKMATNNNVVEIPFSGNANKLIVRIVTANGVVVKKLLN